MTIRIKPIIPDFRVPDIQKIAQAELRREVAAVRRELALPTRTWKHKVVFYEQAASGSQSSGVDVVTDDRPYGWVDKGTRVGKGKYPIRPRKAKSLAFNSVFRAKTKPDSLNSSAGRSTPPKAFTQLVMHPGIKPRHFTKLALKRSRARYKKNVDRAIALAVARANRGK